MISQLEFYVDPDSAKIAIRASDLLVTVLRRVQTSEDSYDLMSDSLSN
jgi:hypothetical protein